MAEIIDADMTPAADVQLQKRSFAADITNQNTTTSSRKKSKPESPPDEFVGGWSEADLSSSEPHSDATEGSEVARRTYGMRAVMQRRQAPKITEDVTFYEHKAPNAVEAAKARQSGVALLAFVPTSEQPLEEMPIDGGVSHTSHVPEISPDVVGVNEVMAASAALGREVNARKKQSKTSGGFRKKGSKIAPEFRVWLSTKEGPEASPWYTDVPKAAADCKRRWPVETAKGYPDYAITKITKQLISLLQGTSPAKFLGSQERIKWDRDNTKWQLAWKEE